MESFTDLKDFVNNPYFHDQRKNYLSKLDIESIDAPIVELISSFAKLDDCFTLQIGCAEWFWEKQVNSYALQVEPKRHMTKDRLPVDYWEALHIEEVRNKFFTQLKKLVQDLID